MTGHDDLRDATFVMVAAASGAGSRVAQLLAALAAEVGGTVVTADAASFADVERAVAEAARVSSAAASIGLPNHEAIAAAKAGVSGLMRSAAATYAPYGLRVNAVAPGLVDTPLSQAITANDLARKASVAMHPLGRLGTPDDIAAAVCWLLGPHSAWVTGQVIGVDGGLATLKPRVNRATPSL